MAIRSLFFDIGGVLLTNGWDRATRKRAAEQFHLEWEPFQERHAQVYDLHEKGIISLEEYLKAAVFWKERAFSLPEFKSFMEAQSQIIPESLLPWIPDIKKHYPVSIVLISNEGRELTEYRFKTFHLAKVADINVVSCFVGFQKPDPRIYQMALDLAQVKPDEVIYIDDRPNLVQAGASAGLNALHHTSLELTRTAVEKFF